MRKGYDILQVVVYLNLLKNTMEWHIIYPSSSTLSYPYLHFISLPFPSPSSSFTDMTTLGGGTVAMYGTASTGKNVSFAGSSGALLTPLLTSDNRSKGGLTGSSGSGTLSNSSRSLSGSDSISSRFVSMYGYDEDEEERGDGWSSTEQTKNRMESVCMGLMQALTLPSLSVDGTREVVRRTLGQGLGQGQGLGPGQGVAVGGGVEEGRSVGASGGAVGLGPPLEVLVTHPLDMRGGNGGSGGASRVGEGGRAGGGAAGGGGGSSLQTTQPHLHPLNHSFNFDDPQSCEEREWQQQVDFILSPWHNLSTELVQMVADVCVRACVSTSRPRNVENCLKSGVKELLVGIVRNARAVLLLSSGDMLSLVTTRNVYSYFSSSSSSLSSSSSSSSSSLSSPSLGT